MGVRIHAARSRWDDATLMDSTEVVMSPFALPVLGPLPWNDVFLLGWFGVTALALIYVIRDTARNPEPFVMKLGWALVTLYMGPVALLLLE
jgi:hypothetical protein